MYKCTKRSWTTSHTRETPTGCGSELLLKNGAGSLGHNVLFALNPLYWITFPSTLYLHLEKKQSSDSFNPSNDLIWISEVPRGRKSNRDCSHGRWRVMGNVCSLVDGCSQEGSAVSFIWSLLYSISPNIYLNCFFTKRSRLSMLCYTGGNCCW